MITSFRAGKPCSDPYLRQLPPKVGPLFQPAQAEDIMFWCPGSSSNTPQPRLTAACISGGLLASGHSVLSCIPRPGFFLPQAADSPWLLPNLALHLPSSLQGADLPSSFHAQAEEEGMLGPLQPTLRLDCWTYCPLTSLLQPGGQKSTAAPSVL